MQSDPPLSALLIVMSLFCARFRSAVLSSWVMLSFGFCVCLGKSSLVGGRGGSLSCGACQEDLR